MYKKKKKEKNMHTQQSNNYIFVTELLHKVYTKMKRTVSTCRGTESQPQYHR